MFRRTEHAPRLRSKQVLLSIAVVLVVLCTSTHTDQPSIVDTQCLYQEIAPSFSGAYKPFFAHTFDVYFDRSLHLVDSTSISDLGSSVDIPHTTTLDSVYTMIQYLNRIQSSSVSSSSSRLPRIEASCTNSDASLFAALLPADVSVRSSLAAYLTSQHPSMSVSDTAALTDALLRNHAPTAPSMVSALIVGGSASQGCSIRLAPTAEAPMVLSSLLAHPVSLTPAHMTPTGLYISATCSPAAVPRLLTLASEKQPSAPTPTPAPGGLDEWIASQTAAGARASAHVASPSSSGADLASAAHWSAIYGHEDAGEAVETVLLELDLEGWGRAHAEDPVPGVLWDESPAVAASWAEEEEEADDDTVLLETGAGVGGDGARSARVGDANGAAHVISGTGDLLGGEDAISNRAARTLDVADSSFDWCDMRAPTANLFCPYSEPSMTMINMASKCLTSALIGPAIDVVARDWMRGQESPIQIAELILLEQHAEVSSSARQPTDADLDPYAAQAKDFSRNQALEAKRALASLIYGANADKQQGAYVMGTPFFDRILQNKYTRDPLLLARPLLQHARAGHVVSALEEQQLRVAMGLRGAENAPKRPQPNVTVAAGSPSMFLSLEASVGAGAGAGVASSDEADLEGEDEDDGDDEELRQQPGMQTSSLLSVGEGGDDSYRKQPYVLPKRVKLVPALKKRLFSELVHKLSEALTEGVVEHATLQTTPLVFDKVADIAKRFIPPAAAHAVTGILSAVVPITVGTGVSDAINRALPPYLIKTVTSGTIDTVTRAATHILANSLTLTLSHSPVVHYYCYYCKYWGHYCEECHRNVSVAGFNQVEYAHLYQCMYADHYTEMYRDRTLWEELGADGPSKG